MVDGTIEIITNLISSVGFPIAAFLLMYYQNLKTKEMLSDKISAMSDALNNNTSVIQNLIQHINK